MKQLLINWSDTGYGPLQVIHKSSAKPRIVSPRRYLATSGPMLKQPHQLYRSVGESNIARRDLNCPSTQTNHNSDDVAETRT